MKLSIKELKALAKLIQGSETDESDVKADESWNDGIESVTFVAAEEEEEESFDVMQFLKENCEQHEYDIALYPYSCSLECYKYSDIVFLKSTSPYDTVNIFSCLADETQETFVLFTPNVITTRREFESILSIAKKMNNESN